VQLARRNCILSAILDIAMISLRVNSRPIYLQTDDNSFAEVRKPFFFYSDLLTSSRRICRCLPRVADVNLVVSFRLTRTDRNNSVVGACSQTKRDNSVIGLR